MVPLLWELEFANGVMVAERRRILDAVEADRSMERMELLKGTGIEVADVAVDVRELLRTSRTFGLTAYDAVYLDLARSEGLPLATLDRKLAQAAKKAGVKLA